MFSRADLTGRDFAFFRRDGELLSDRVRLEEDGRVSNCLSDNERFWRLEHGALVLLDLDRRITSRFEVALRHRGMLVLLGCFVDISPTEIWHVLWQAGPPEAGEGREDAHPEGLDDRAARIENGLERLHGRVHDLQQTLNLVSRRPVAGDGVVRVLFLVHAIETWDSLADIHAEMCASARIEPTVASIPRRYPGDRSFDGEPDTHEGLSALGVPHLRLRMTDGREALDIVKAIAPDVIFRQSPWELDVPDAFSTAQLGFARLCYVPYYGFNLLARFSRDGPDEVDFYADQAFHRMCWRIFCETESTLRLMRANSARDGSNVVVTGHPKLDRLDAARLRPSWPIRRDGRAFRLVWAPHHSVGASWLGFGTFVETHAAMLRWAREDRGIEIVLKPHPALYGRLVEEGSIPAAELDAFLLEWDRLPNTAIGTGGDYGPLLAASDAMVTDGISFLAEYQIFDRPLVFLDSGRHTAFNPVGEQVMAGAYVARGAEEARALLGALRIGAPDRLAPARAAIRKALLPYPGEAARRVVAEIVRGVEDGRR